VGPKNGALDEVLLKNGFMLDYTVTPGPEFKKNEVFLVKDTHKESLVCLNPNIAPRPWTTSRSTPSTSSSALS